MSNQNSKTGLLTLLPQTLIGELSRLMVNILSLVKNLSNFKDFLVSMAKLGFQTRNLLVSKLETYYSPQTIIFKSLYLCHPDDLKYEIGFEHNIEKIDSKVFFCGEKLVSFTVKEFSLCQNH